MFHWENRSRAPSECLSEEHRWAQESRSRFTSTNSPPLTRLCCRCSECRPVGFWPEGRERRLKGLRCFSQSAVGVLELASSFLILLVFWKMRTKEKYSANWLVKGFGRILDRGFQSEEKRVRKKKSLILITCQSVCSGLKRRRRLKWLRHVWGERTEIKKKRTEAEQVEMSTKGTK